MIGRLGHACLAAGMVAALCAALLWLRVALSGRGATAARTAAWAAFGAAGAANGLLVRALAAHDFGVAYVAANGGRDVPLYFTVTSLWAALDGSLLLWLLIIGAFGALLAWRIPARPAPLHAHAAAVLSVVAVFFFALTYFAADPFRPVSPVPADGPGPNPLLREHAAMGMHPPLLYLGYIGMVVPFAYGVAALVTGATGREWQSVTRNWALVAWTFLTAGIVLGAWWSYAVLGWGGYWAWDPVENASLLPWLTATAALHMTLRRGGGLTGWAVTLYTSTFLLVLLGTFLTRSGAVASVHSFTASPLGPMLLAFVLLVAAVVTGLLIWRAGVFGGPAPASSTAPLSRERIVLANGVVFAALAAVVLTGTVFPLLAQGLTGRRLSVGPGYFDRTAVPVALVALLLMGAGPLVRPRADTPGALSRRLAVPAILALATIAAAGLPGRPGVPALLAFGAAAFVLTALGRVLAGEVRAARGTGTPLLPALLRRRRWGGLLAHAGVAVAIVGIAASSAYTAHTEAELALGQSLTVDGVTATLTGVDRSADAGRMTASARFRLDRDGTALGSAEAALHYYRARDTTVSVPAIRSRPGGDLYLTVTGIAADGQHVTVRLAVNPLVGLLWAGGAITALGGLLSLVRRKPRPVPASRRTPAPEVSAA